MTTTVAIVMKVLYRSFALPLRVQRHAHNHRNGHQRQKERPCIEEEKEGCYHRRSKRGYPAPVATIRSRLSPQWGRTGSFRRRSLTVPTRW